MPKIKSHSGTKNRIRVTPNGRVMARKSHRNHNLTKKKGARKRTFRQFNTIDGKIGRNIKKNLNVK